MSDESEMSEVNLLVRLVQDAIDQQADLNAASKARDLALNRLVAKLGGDRLGAISRGQLQIGRLLTEEGGRW